MLKTRKMKCDGRASRERIVLSMTADREELVFSASSTQQSKSKRMTLLTDRKNETPVPEAKV